MSDRWKPEISEKYWFVDSLHEVQYDTWGDFTIDRKLFDSGNCFKTKEEAKAVAEKFKALLECSHEPTTNSSQLPKLTTEVFDRTDCPEWAKWAAVDEDGTAVLFDYQPEKAPRGIWWERRAHHYCLIGKRGGFDASDWKNSLIERPANGLPDWCKVGEWVYYEPRSAYCKIEQMCDGFMLRFINGNSTAIPRCDVKTIKQARLRPYSADEMKALVGRVVTNAEGNDYLCTAFKRATDNSVAVVDIDTWVGATYILEHGYTVDSKQCGVLEHLENGEWVK